MIPVHYDVEAAVAGAEKNWRMLIGKSRAAGIDEALIAPQERMVPVHLAMMRAELTMMNDGFTATQVCEGLASMLASIATGHTEAWRKHFSVAFETYVAANLAGLSASSGRRPIPAMAGGHA